ncbi:MAG: hypothetical protein A3F78_10350 [Burkholderiales bacterium RIFCSPLOWO2_12_FULL_61_40]|nr:MAG: hypothetical protein A3F78_10350 [Burkholderiales bacterium RIFCSPLOWO2_12_FULL_61_40]
MTVGELISLLSQYPEEMCVGVQGYRERYFGDIKANLIQVSNIEDIEWGYPHCWTEDKGISILVLDAGPYT